MTVLSSISNEIHVLFTSEYSTSYCKAEYTFMIHYHAYDINIIHENIIWGISRGLWLIIFYIRLPSGKINQCILYL